MTQIAENHRRIVQKMNDAAMRCGRDPQSIRLIAVTKTVPPERIQEAADCGVRHVGENRFQEGVAKQEALQSLNLTWHFIGHLQTNKAKRVAECFSWVHSVDRIDLAEKLNHFAAKPLSVLIEVRLHEEPNKSGVDVEELPVLVRDLGRCENLRLCGLMAVPPYLEHADDVRPYFRRLRELAEQFQLHELSMGMTHDFEVAIEEGATMIRVGTGLFGARQPFQ